jgi:homoserine dehydrogenase
MRADLALIGFGNVARRFARVLAEKKDPLENQYDLNVRIVAIATGQHGHAFHSDGLDAVRLAQHVEHGGALEAMQAPGQRTPVSNLDCIELLAASSAPLKVVVETTTLNIRDGRPAIDHVEGAISAGCHVVTANKGPAAFAYRRLDGKARSKGVAFLFEGAVMDGVPIFNLVRETMPAVTVEAFRGVVNTTTNYIISMLESGEEFEPALAFMQQQGVAEADASLDIDGWDAAAKAAALANVLLAADVTPHDVKREGIGPATREAARAALRAGRRLRLVASGRRHATPQVSLQELAAVDLLAGVSGTANALVLQTDLLGEVAVTQLGGDLTQTAYALLSDLVAIRRRLPVLLPTPADRTP